MGVLEGGTTTGSPRSKNPAASVTFEDNGNHFLSLSVVLLKLTTSQGKASPAKLVNTFKVGALQTSEGFHFRVRKSKCRLSYYRTAKSIYITIISACM